MRIFIIHNRYQQRGGEDFVFEQDTALLREHGHEVFLYEESNDRLRSMNPVRAFFRTVWSLESYRRVSALIRLHQPDVIHVHNFFPLISPSVFYAAARHKVPVVQTLHNYRLMCANALFFRGGRVCEDCLGRAIPWPGVWHACYRNSHLGSFAVATMLTMHRLAGTWRRRVTAFIALSAFARKKFIVAGLPPARLLARPNYIPDPGWTPDAPRRDAIFVGMLHPWKGVDVLLESWARRVPRARLNIVGDGPQRATLEQAADVSVEFRGVLQSPDVLALIKSACFLIFPSICYESMPRTILEAFACGTPVLASRLGAAAELVHDGQTGLHFDPGNSADLAEKIGWAINHPLEMAVMGRQARQEYLLKYTPDSAYGSLMEVYAKVLQTA